MREFVFSGLLGCLLIAVSGLVIYEILRGISSVLPRLTWRPRTRMLFVMAGLFCGHIVNIWLFGLVHYALVSAGWGNLSGGDVASGMYESDIFGYVYFSAATYTTLGIGDLVPTGALRMITTVESLSGFLLIGWTVSFTYLTMEKFWDLHKS